MKVFTSHKSKTLIKKVFVLAFWVFVWQTVYMIVNKDLLIASPYRVGLCLFELAGEKAFWLITLSSLTKIISGFLFGVVFGTVLAVVTCSVKFLYELFYPVISIIRSTPVASFIILALVWIKRENISLFICFLMVLPIVWANVSQGIRSVDGKLLEMGKVYKFSKGMLLKKIYIPSVLPSFITAVITSLGFSWKAGIAAEVLATPKDYIGTQLYNSKVYLETDKLFAWTLVVILLSFILEKVVVKLLKSLMKRGMKR